MIELVGCVLIGIIGITFIAMLIDELRTNYKIRKDLEGDNKMGEYMEAKSHPISSCAELSKYFIGRHEIVPVYLTPQFEKEFNAKMYQLENLQQTPKELIDYLKEQINECKLTGNEEDYIRADTFEEILYVINEMGHREASNLPKRNRLITTYKEFEENIKNGKEKLVKGYGRLIVYHSLNFLRKNLEENYSEELEDSVVSIIGYIDDLENEVNKFERQQSNYIKYLKNLATQNEVSSDFAVGCKVAYGMALKRYIEMKNEVKGE